AGHPVLLLPDRAPVAFALPRRHGGIVISRGLLDSLAPRELSAVLAHEQAHLSQHHHSVLAVLDAIAGPLRMIPLFDAVVTAVPPRRRRPPRPRRAPCCTRPVRSAADRTGSGTWSPPPQRARRWCRRRPSPPCSPRWSAPRSPSSRRTRRCC